MKDQLNYKGTVVFYASRHYTKVKSKIKMLLPNQIAVFTDIIISPKGFNQSLRFLT